MTARPRRHLHLIHSRPDEPEPELEAVNWGCLVAVAASLVVWALIIAGVVLFVV